ncbi:hypothetical protein XELAEV_180072782mg, partial [Xenopus laevis]
WVSRTYDASDILYAVIPRDNNSTKL